MRPTPPTELRTARTLVRPHGLDEATALRAAVLASRDHLARWIRWGADCQTLEGAEVTLRIEHAEWVSDENFVLGIYTPDGETLIGGTGFHPRQGSLGRDTTEIGMWVAESHCGMGIASEVLSAMLDWAFTDWWWERVEWRCDPRNGASVAVARRAGMVHELTLRSASLDTRGERCDTAVYACTRSDYLSRSLA